MDKSTRYINMYRGFAILCMVISRVVFIDARITNVLGAFCFCMLFVAEGAEYDVKDAARTKKYLHRYLIPYCAFSLVMAVYQIVSTAVIWHYVSFSTFKIILIDTFTLFGESMLWFVSASLVGMLVYNFARARFSPKVIMLGAGVLLAAYLLCGNVFDYLYISENVFALILIRLFAVSWRAVFACLYIALGEMLASLLGSEAVHKKRNITVPAGFALVAVGILVAVYNGGVYVANLILGKEAMFYGSTIMICIGLMLIAEWIGVLGVLEVLGDNAVVIIVTFIDFRIIYMATRVDDAVLKAVNNRFVAHATQAVFIFLVELALVILFSRLLPFMQGRKAYNPFECMARGDSDSQE